MSGARGCLNKQLVVLTYPLVEIIFLKAGIKRERHLCFESE